MHLLDEYQHQILPDDDIIICSLVQVWSELYLCNFRIMSMFKKHLQEGENREPVNMVNLFIDITAYNAVGSSPAVKQKKDMQATYIQKYV